MGRVRARISIVPEDERSQPWEGVEDIMFGSLGHADGFDEYTADMDIPIVEWTHSLEPKTTAGGPEGSKRATPPKRGLRPRMKSVPSPTKASTGGMPMGQSNSPSPARTANVASTSPSKRPGSSATPDASPVRTARTGSHPASHVKSGKSPSSGAGRELVVLLQSPSQSTAGCGSAMRQGRPTDTNDVQEDAEE
ncbi:hypothetical protein FRC08_007394 [Ceratobasidium sp. 394]|nr:hypothetical protein FRC08_007394 [Ceratobasidium sp. 394]